MGIPVSTLKVAIGRESTSAWGSDVAQTVKLMGVNEFTINPGVTIQQIEDIRGTREPSHMSVVPRIAPTATLKSLLLYEDLPFWLDSLVNHAVKTGDSTSAGWTRVYYAPKQSSDSENFSSYTMAYGDATNIFALRGATVQSLTISGETGQPGEVSVDLPGKIVTTDTFDSTADRSVNPIMGADWSLWIDPGSDAVGTSQISRTAFSFELNLNRGGNLLRHLGSRTPDTVQHGRMTGDLRLVLELSSDTEPYLDSLVSATQKGIEKNVRLKSTNASTNELTIDFCGVILGEPTVFGDVDGVTTVDFTLSGTKTADSDWFRITVLNNSSNF